MKKLPIGMQDYREIIEENYIYVDKTKYLYNLINSGKFYFMSRPRRFGKSLTVSTFYYLFKGEKELFKGTYIYDRWEFKEYPIIRLNLLKTKSEDKNKLKESLTKMIVQEGKRNGIKIEEIDYSFAFDELIMKLSEKEKVVILVDEYEKPILDNITNKEMAEECRDVLRDFYLNIKANDEHIKFVFITGITKFTEQTAKKFGITEKELLKEMKKYYNGFSFDGEHLLV